MLTQAIFALSLGIIPLNCDHLKDHIEKLNCEGALFCPTYIYTIEELEVDETKQWEVVECVQRHKEDVLREELCNGVRH